MSKKWTEERVSHWFITAWAEQLANAVRNRDTEHETPLAPLVPGEPHREVWEAWTEPLWYSVEADVKAGAELFIGCAKHTALELSGTEEAAASPNSIFAAYEQLINKTIEHLRPIVEEKTGGSVGFAAAAASVQPKMAQLGIEYRFKLGEAVHLLALVPSAALVDSLLSAEPKDEGDADREALTPAASENLNMLMDVDLDLSVSFGKTHLLLEDVLKLAAGSIVELNRSANDPVDLLINNSLVAQGEVVVVDGNYGIRITEIVSQTARIRSVL